MADELNIPESAQVLKTRNRTDIENQIPESDPFVETNWVTALSDSNANRQYDFFQQLVILKAMMFWDTTTGESLSRWANIWVGPQNPATQSAGSIIATGTLAAVVSFPEELTSENGNIYETTADGTIILNTITLTNLTSVGTTATATLDTSTPLAPNALITVTGANEADYNVVDAVPTVITDTEVQYTMASSTTSPATGSPLELSYEGANIPVISQSFGQAANQDAFTSLNFTSPLAGIDSLARVDVNALGGGTDIESDDDYRDRMLERVRGYLAFFTKDTINVFIRDNVSGVTKVWVFDPDDAQGGTPGQTIIYFIRGNDDDIIPDGSEVLAVKTLMDSDQKPAHMATADLIVNAPTPVSTPFNFTSIDPDTTSMRTSIEASLDALMKNQTDVGEALTEDRYRAAIQETFDTSTGASLDTFVLSTPSGDVGGGAGELPTLGAVTFS